MNRWLIVAASLCTFGCSASVRRPVEPTEAATQLEEVTFSSDNELDPAVSPNAKTLAYERAATSGAWSHVEVMSLNELASGNRGHLWYASAEVMGREPAWKPDGSGIVFVANTSGSRRLVEVFGDGTGRVPFIFPRDDVSFPGEWPSVAPDGATVAMGVGSVTSFETGWPTTRSLDDALVTSSLRGLGVNLLGRGAQAVWSPDGKRLAFVRSHGGHVHVFVADGEGNNPEPVTDGSSDDVEPTWAPDGRRLAFCSVSSLDVHPHANIFFVNTDGSGLLQLTEGDRVSCHPSWGADGFIYFHANASDHFHIWRLRPSPAPG
jgi:Tol biopolymer transport system component